MDRAEYLERVSELLPAIAQRATDAEEQRKVPEETFKEFRELRLLAALQPASWGGFELDPPAFFEAVMRVAAACPSTGWVLGVLGVHQWQLALFPEAAQREVWGERPGSQISSSYAPTGKIEVLDGGYRLRGRWSFSSGCDHCEWVFLGGIVPGDAPDMRTFLLPRSDYEIDDTWHVAGLCGSGSKDIVVEDAFVPEHRTHRFLDGFRLDSPGNDRNRGPVYRLPFGTVFSNAIAFPVIGAAQGASDSFREQTRRRVASYDRAKVAEDSFTQVRFAQAIAEIDAARERLRSNWEALMASVNAARSIPMEFRARCRWDAANAVRLSVAAVGRLFEVSGGRAIYLDNPIQRAFRDVHAMRAHAVNNPEKGARAFGRSELLPSDGPADFLL